MHPIARKIRPLIKHIPGAWVRVWNDPERGQQIWASATGGIVRWSTREGMLAVKAALEAGGYICDCNGKPGTEGEHIIDVRLP